MDIKSFLVSFKPHSTLTSPGEKVRSGIAGGVAILLLMLALQYLPQTGLHLIIVASMAASVTLLYATPHSPLTQPWNLVGGHLVSAFVGQLCSMLIPAPTVAAGAAVGSSILVMEFLNCLHPPGAATALLMVLANSQLHSIGWQWSIYIVTVNAGVLLVLALVLNNLLPGRRYPMRVVPHPHPKPAPCIAPEQSDLEWALQQLDSVIDVSEEDLLEIYELAQQRALARSQGKSE